MKVTLGVESMIDYKERLLHIVSCKCIIDTDKTESYMGKCWAKDLRWFAVHSHTPSNFPSELFSFVDLFINFYRALCQNSYCSALNQSVGIECFDQIFLPAKSSWVDEPRDLFSVLLSHTQATASWLFPFSANYLKWLVTTMLWHRLLNWSFVGRTWKPANVALCTNWIGGCAIQINPERFNNYFGYHSFKHKFTHKKNDKLSHWTRSSFDLLFLSSVQGHIDGFRVLYILWLVTCHDVRHLRRL